MPHADYVIVGAGSAGCVLANRLSEDPGTTVLLLEAGGRDRSINIKAPAAFAKQFKTKLDWDFSTEPEPGCEGRSIYVPRGRSLGGSSSMNAMLYVRGRPLDYDLWEREGAAGWGWEDVRPYFLRSEHNERGASEHHAVGGPLNVMDERSPRRLTREFLASCEAAGIPYVDDYNGPEQDGCSLAQVTQRDGRRFSTADAYLRPAEGRPNLTVVTRAQVSGLEWSGDRVVGVRFVQGRRRTEVLASARREVLLSAGTLNSPQLLMLAGVGPEEQLRAHGIDVRVDAPGVGRDLQDHPYVGGVWDVPGGGSLADAETPRALGEWLARRSGPLTSSICEAFAFVRSRPGLPAPDLQFHFAPAYFVDNGFEKHDGHAVTFGGVLVSPKSRGEVTLRSADPLAKVRILTNSLTEPEDIAALVEGIKIARRIAASEPYASTLGRELYPGADVVDDLDLEEHTRRNVELLYHPVGTCRMGTDDEAVVDPDLRVRGVEGLRVIDASVMPLVPGGNTNAPTIMIAERAADLIRGRVASPQLAAS